MRKSFLLNFKWLLTLPLIFSEISRAELKNDANFRTIAGMVAAMVEGLHARRPRLNDAVSKKTYEAFLDKLDPHKMYLDADDVKTLSSFETKLDEQILDGNLDFPDQAVAIFRQRLSDRSQLIKILLDEPEDFTGDVSVPADIDKIPYANPGAEYEKHVRKVIRFRRLNLKLANEKQTLEERKASLALTIEREKNSFLALTDREVFEEYLDAFTTSVDPNSHYLLKESADEVMQEVEQKIVFGVGIRPARTGDGGFEVGELIEGGPAQVQGKMEVGDRILAISSDGTIDHLRDVAGLTEKKIARRLRGKENSPVLLTVLSKGNLRNVPLQRSRVSLDFKNEFGKVREIVSAESGKKYSVGEIYLPAFYRGASNDVGRWLASDDFKNIDLLIFDLRGNTGGETEEAMLIASKFLERGQMVVRLKNNEGDTRGDRSRGDRNPYTGPMVIVVNAETGSVAETLTSALQDNGRALIIGSDTSGKNTVQNPGPIVSQGVLSGMFPDRSKGMLILTVVESFSPRGKNPKVNPDVVLPSIGDVKTIRESDLPNALNAVDIGERVDFVPAATIAEPLKEELRNRSLQRQKNIAQFAALVAAVEERRKIKASGVISLNEETRRKQKADTGENNDLELGERIPLVIPKWFSDRAAELGKTLPTFYNDEIRNIAVDYIEKSAKR